MPFRSASLAALLVAAAASRPRAQTFPSRTIHIVVAYAPGGTGDIVARLIAVPLAEALGQNIVIENRAGATGAIGTQAVVIGAARRPHAADGPDRRDRDQPALDQGPHLRRREGPACRSRSPPWCRSRSSVPAKAPYSTMAEMAQGADRARSRSPSPPPAPARRATSPANSSSSAPRPISPTCPTRARVPRSTICSAATSICISRAFPRRRR